MRTWGPSIPQIQLGLWGRGLIGLKGGKSSSGFWGGGGGGTQGEEGRGEG